MDAFYAAIEQRDRPELRGRPVIVGASPTGRGVISAASYEARRFGVHSAMPIGRAARLCPQGAFLPVDMRKYQRVSVEVMGILADFSPLVEPVSVDEAFRDLGFTTIGQLQRAPRTVLAERFGKHGEALADLAFGRDDRPVEPFGVPKSIGAEETFGVDCTNPDELKTTLRAHAERVAAEL